jgi:hypothetical protein
VRQRGLFVLGTGPASPARCRWVTQSVLATQPAQSTAAPGYVLRTQLDDVPGVEVADKAAAARSRWASVLGRARLRSLGFRCSPLDGKQGERACDRAAPRRETSSCNRRRWSRSGSKPGRAWGQRPSRIQRPMRRLSLPGGGMSASKLAWLSVHSTRPSSSMKSKNAYRLVQSDISAATSPSSSMLR